MKTPTTGWILIGSTILIGFGCAKPHEPAAADPDSVIQMEDFEGDVKLELSKPESASDVGDGDPQAVTDFVTAWIGERAGADGIFDIPERSGHNGSGKLADFHTVDQTDGSSYTVCVDFADGDHTYDVDFAIASTADGYAVHNHFLHKIDGNTIE